MLQNQAAYNKIKEWMNTSNSAPILALYGPAGSGKSVALEALSVAPFVDIDYPGHRATKKDWTGDQTLCVPFEPLTVANGLLETESAVEIARNFLFSRPGDEVFGVEAVDSPSPKLGFHTPKEWLEARDRMKADSHKVFCRWSSVGIGGCQRIEAFHPDYDYPIGSLLYRVQTGRTYNICNIYVLEGLRGAGIADKMLDLMITFGREEKIHTILTARVNEFSHPWAKRNGFGWSDASDCWMKPIVESVGESDA